ncbi:trimethylamine methyltransferase family protein [Moorella naiadis]|uniref:trimethylamine methyltransferase family protein n=1 Tax=Moorella naiadis (nom. illeg.) TaxID=3093670 RepID=UPI003D9CBAB9
MSRPVLTVLSRDEIEAIKAGSLRILESTGISITYAPAREVLQAAGARVEGEYIFFPSRLVEEAVAKAPRQFTIYARNPARNVTVGSGQMVLAPGYGAPFITDGSGKKRRATWDDFVVLARLAGASENINISGGVLVEPVDVPAGKRHKVMLYSCMANSDKPFMGSATGADHARDSIAMAARLFGGENVIREKPVMITLINSLTPLMFDERMTGALMAHAEAGQPLIIASLAMAGSTSPATLAGTLAVQNAEVLAGIVLAETVREGTPVVYGSASSITDMRYGSLSIGAPEGAWLVAATAQIAHAYGFPCRAGGCLSDSKLPDSQAAYESMMNLQSAGLAGVDFVLHAAGILESYLSMSLEKFVIDDEICGMVRRYLAGTRVDVDGLALELIEATGPGGQFLTSEHTYRHFKSEFWQPSLASRSSYDQWQVDGARDLLARASVRLKEMLAGYEIPALDPGLDRELRAMVEA